MAEVINGEIILTEEEKKVLKQPLPKKWAENIINKIVWGDTKEFYDK